MTINFRRPLAMTLILAAVVSPAGIALVARIAKPETIPPADITEAVKEGALPVGTSVILAYYGELYIIPDKQLVGKMASEMVMGSAPRSRD